MNTILLGNIFAFAGCTLMVFTGLIKKKEKILLTQNAQFILQGIANFLLGGISGVVANAVSIVRNTICLKWDLTLPLKIFFIAIQAVLTILTNDMVLVGWLPFVAAVLFTAILDTKNEALIKLVIIIGEFCWITYDLLIHNYTGCAFDTFTVITNIIGIILLKTDKKWP